MDLKSLSATVDNLVVNLKHPVTKEQLYNDEDATPMTITMLSPFSKDAKIVLHELTDKRLADASKNGTTKLKAADLEAFSLDSLTKTTVTWNITWDGVKPEFNVDLAKDVYTLAFWIKDQIEEAQNLTVGFMKG